MSIRDNINAGKYKNNLTYPEGKKFGTPERTAYRAETQRLGELFRDDLFAEYGVTDNPKAAKCYLIAEELGHSSGMQEVANYFDDLVALIKD